MPQGCNGPSARPHGNPGDATPVRRPGSESPQRRERASRRWQRFATREPPPRHLGTRRGDHEKIQDARCVSGLAPRRFRASAHGKAPAPPCPPAPPQAPRPGIRLPARPVPGRARASRRACGSKVWPTGRCGAKTLPPRMRQRCATDPATAGPLKRSPGHFALTVLAPFLVHRRVPRGLRSARHVMCCVSRKSGRAGESECT